MTMLTKDEFEELKELLADGLKFIGNTQDSGRTAYGLRSYMLTIAEVLTDPVQFHYLLRSVGITDDYTPEDDAEYEKDHPLTYAD